MYSILIVVHVIISLFLIAVILLQAGKGGGLADTFGGSQMQNLFGTKSTTVLTKLTAVCAIGFIVTCISLALISSHQARSIVDNVSIPQAAPVSAPQANPMPQAKVPASVEPAQQGGASEVK
ncbi:MAG: preprotein translocase subunit SecG [Omnitrophica bacterium GWA2_41_15]|nr:MAG: preprotein translocase subunit SecG [Omnitrophica bacterium GWA2_41_15]HAZ10133.1 preprotein translocase subunit SecG [Candidatus Omnitrophota bacterium]